MSSRLLLAGAATVAALTLAPAAQAAVTTDASANWAGYAVHRGAVHFQRVGASWTVPAVDCRSVGWSATWVGLGGFRASARALEQIGTAADCSARGRATYASWYELVPAAARGIRLTTRAGDRMRASVVVRGHVVRLRLANLTRGIGFRRTLIAPHIDVTSAEWIVEAPTVCAGFCAILPLADFGTTQLTGASATTRSGHTGTIVDRAWNTTAIALSSDSGADGPGGSAAPAPGDTARRRNVAGASVGALDATGSAFGVTYVA